MAAYGRAFNLKSCSLASPIVTLSNLTYPSAAAITLNEHNNLPRTGLCQRYSVLYISESCVIMQTFSTLREPDAA